MRSRLAVLLALAALLLPTPALLTSRAAEGHTFPETGHTVNGAFWTYWQGHGGLAQQGYPLSDVMEQSENVLS